MTGAAKKNIHGLYLQVKSPHCKISPVNIAPTFIKINLNIKSSYVQ